MMNERAEQHYKFVSPRLLCVMKKVGIRRLFISAGYTPIGSGRSEVKYAFWGTLNYILGTYDHGEKFGLLGDMNGWVTVRRKGTYTMLGHSEDPITNYNWCRLVL